MGNQNLSGRSRQGRWRTRRLKKYSLIIATAKPFMKKAERAGIEPATAGVIRLLLVLKTRWDTSPVPSLFA
ncbi:MAG: hypothetical protein DRJ05_06945 [Bacteroidetes bacterium]|nr:MAG: hypothetical protein DRJ05_06945 [Bacteroidota bacterium]